MATTPSNPRYFGVHLVTREQRERWNALVKLPVQPSRYPDDEALHKLGIQQCFWELCAVGGLTTLFRWQQDSFRRLTLEFLSTLEVHMSGRRVESITFRLRNNNFDLSIAEVNAIFNFFSDDVGVVEEPADYDRDAFWSAITLPEGGNARFVAARAKGTQIRNPVLRLLQKACVYLPFARFEAGTVLRDEVFLLWNILNGRCLNMGHFIVRHLERQARKTSGTLCCGGIITSLALDCGIDVEGFAPDIGEKALTMDVLRQMQFMNVDTYRRGFFLQKAGDHFPFPDPVNTYVHGWQFQTNWRMNEAVHQQLVAAHPPSLPWVNSRFNPYVPFRMPVPERPPSPPLQLEAPPAHEDEVGPSNRRRRRRRQPGQEEEDISVAQRLDHLEVTMNDNFNRLHERFDVFEAQQRSETERMDRFDHMLTSMYDRFNTWTPYPPPPPPQ